MSQDYLKLFLISCLIIFTTCQNSVVRKQDCENPPNILFIAVDDLRPDLGCYGNSVVKTPHLDNLANEGLLFKNHYVQVPTCGPSRHCMLTGMRPRSRAQLNNNVTAKLLSDKEETAIPETFIHHLRNNGYYTVGIGKISHSADGLVYGYTDAPSTKRELPHSWDELLFDSGKWGTGWNAFFGYADGENRQSRNKEVRPYEKGATNDEGYPDGLTAKLAVSKLTELKESKQPFFLGVGFFKPHLPFNAPEKYWDLYDRDSISVSANPDIPEGINLKSLHNSGEFNSYQSGDEKPSLQNRISDDYAKKLKHAYYACMSYTDAQVGRVLNELNALGLDESTIVVVWSDHGWHLGDQRIWGKHTLSENSLKSVLIIKNPKYQDSEVVNSIVETVDIYPSLMEMCNLELPYETDGKSFVPLLKGNDSDWKNVAYGYFKNGISLRIEQYRLTQYFRKEEPTIELFDHSIDPLESKNIAREFPNIVKELMPIVEKGNTGLYN